MRTIREVFGQSGCQMNSKVYESGFGTLVRTGIKRKYWI